MTTDLRTRCLFGAPPLAATGIDLERFNPKRGGKYSPNLYAFLAHPRQANFTPLARLWLDGEGRQWLGFFLDAHSFVGARLSMVLGEGRKQGRGCFETLGPLREVEDFWAQYAVDGRCAIDRQHRIAFIGDDTRWSQQARLRTCLWCHKVTQRLVRTVETVTHERWTPER